MSSSTHPAINIMSSLLIAFTAALLYKWKPYVGFGYLTYFVLLWAGKSAK